MGDWALLPKFERSASPPSSVHSMVHGNLTRTRRRRRSSGRRLTQSVLPAGGFGEEGVEECEQQLALRRRGAAFPMPARAATSEAPSQPLRRGRW
jgi:hypothetical protein